MLISLPGSKTAPGVLIAGVSTRLPFGEAYRGFFEQLATSVTAAAVHAKAYQDQRERAERLAEMDRVKTTFFSNVRHEFRTPLTLMLGPLEGVLARTDLSDEHRQPIGSLHRNSLTLGHELRTPWNAILGRTQIIQSNGNLPDDVVQGIEVIRRDARLQAQIIEDSLDMSISINGKIRLDVQRVDLAALTDDPSRLQKVLWNRLTNALKFTPRPGQIQVLLRRVAKFEPNSGSYRPSANQSG